MAVKMHYTVSLYLANGDEKGVDVENYLNLTRALQAS